jgi:23S rRNA pseudouridine2457 synthase
LSLLLFNKPFQVLTAFAPKDGRACIRDYLSAPGFHPAGRLDFDSEGLLLLTDVGQLQAQLSDPRWKVAKTYLVQVEGIPAADALLRLRDGVRLNDGITLPATVEIVTEPTWVWPRDPPIRFRKLIPTTWLRLSIREGRNRQVRRMTAAVGCPTLRLIRWSVGQLTLQGLAPGESRDASEAEMRQFKIEPAVHGPRSAARKRRG